MAVTHGKDGAVYLGANLVASVTQWNGTFDSGFAQKRYLQAEYGDQIGGIKQMTGSINCDTDSADTNGQAAMATAVTGQTTVRLYLYINATSYWEFNAHLQLTDTIDVGDVIKRSFNYMSSSTISAPS
jgi:hypothetical protein